MNKTKCGGVCKVYQNGCKLHEYEDCFVVTDPHGTTIRKCRCVLDADELVDEWEHINSKSKKKRDVSLKNTTKKLEKVIQGETAPVPKGVEEDLLKALWGSRKVTRLNKIRNPSYFGPLTVRELATLVLLEKGDFPKGLDTPISTGDVERNSSQHKYSIMTGGMKSDHVCLSYEMHEMEEF